MKVLVLNGPNLGRLDLRDSNIYGNLDFAGLKSEIVSTGKELVMFARVIVK
jgi:3-dehydroquinate dehydratase II